MREYILPSRCNRTCGMTNAPAISMLFRPAAEDHYFDDIYGLGNTPVSGTAWEPQPYIKVNFWWMIVPVFLWLLATVEWVLTIWLTWQSGTPTWKSSLLAVLESQRAVARAPTLRQLVADAGTQHARLVPQGSSWQLRHEDSNENMRHEDQ